MNSHRTISEYKSQAKERLLGNYRAAIGSFALCFAIIYLIGAVIIECYSLNTLPAGTMDAAGLSNALAGADSLTSDTSAGGFLSSSLLSEAIVLIVGIIENIMLTGFMYVLKEMSYGRQTKISDIFYVFKHNPDKVIIMSLIIELAAFVLSLPQKVYSYVNSGNDGGQVFFVQTLLAVIYIALFLVVKLYTLLCWLIYIDGYNQSSVECLKKSFVLMKGSVIRTAYMFLSFIGLYILGIISIGIGLLWVMPYQYMCIVMLYRDLTGDLDDAAAGRAGAENTGRGGCTFEAEA